MQHGRLPARCSRLVPFREQGDAPAIFCVHPASGDVLCYAPLVHALGAQQPFYAFLARGLEEHESPVATVTQLAREYLDMVRDSGCDRYVLAGWSMGGLVALEMAQQMRRSHLSVAPLLLFDTPLVPAPSDEHTRQRRLLELFLASLRLDSSAHATQFLIGLSPDAQLDVILLRAQESNILPRTFTPAELLRLYQVFRCNVHAMWSYEPMSYDGQVHFFQPAQSLATHASLAAWTTLTAGKLRVHPVPGDHFTLLRPPHVGAVAAAVLAALKESPSR